VLAFFYNIVEMRLTSKLHLGEGRPERVSGAIGKPALSAGHGHGPCFNDTWYM
jgi:hypothetical protein